MNLYIGTYQEQLSDVNNQVARMAAKYGADAFVVIGAHFGGRHDIDTVHAKSVSAALDMLDQPYLVSVETDGFPLRDFTDQPANLDRFYLLGPTNGTIPDFVLSRSHAHVTIETPPPGEILPTPACAAIVLHHHYVNTRVAA